MLDAKITYKDEDGKIRTVLLSEIIKDIGWEYSISEDVLKLTEKSEILKIEILKRE